MNISPEKIMEIYRGTPPYQVEDLMKHYIGQEICRDLNYYSVTKQADSRLRVSFYSLKGNILISCNINEDVFPSIKIIPKETPITLV